MTTSSCLIDLVFPGETNHHGTLFGGAALSYMDKLAYIIATRHAHTDFVTASCERIDFGAPARLSQIIEVTGRLTRTGRRSLSIETDLMAEDVKTGERHLCSRGVFHMVTADKSVTVPPLPERAEPPPPDGTVRMTELVFPDQSSHRQVLFGGYALAVMGKAAFVAATRLCRKTVVMAASSRMDFTAPVHVGEIMELTAAVSTVGRSSMTVSVTAWSENLHTGERRPAVNGSFVMVAVDDKGRPTAIG